MILKLRTSHAHGGTWRYLDGIRDVQTYGPVQDGSQSGPGEDLTIPADWESLVAAVKRTWGEDRTGFDHEYWPTYLHPSESQGGQPLVRIDAVVARTVEDRALLVLLGDECFLLGDDGGTVDRLR